MSKWKMPFGHGGVSVGGEHYAIDDEGYIRLPSNVQADLSPFGGEAVPEDDTLDEPKLPLTAAPVEPAGNLPVEGKGSETGAQGDDTVAGSTGDDTVAGGDTNGDGDDDEGEGEGEETPPAVAGETPPPAMTAAERKAARKAARRGK